ncbi:manganese ion binding protein [Aureococcus anophagefferens]|nr:manganese ion binding protein [Aureococcus anophagefferens]
MSAAAQSVVKFKLKPIAPQECAASASELAALVGLDQVRVVFRGGAKNREAHEKAGLHLWYQGVAPTPAAAAQAVSRLASQARVDVAEREPEALELEATPDEGVTRSNVGGFHGHTDAFELAECAAARTFLEAAAPEAAAARPAKRARFAVEVEGARLVVDGGGGAHALTVGVEDGVLSLDAAARAGDADRGGGGVEAWFNVSRAGHFNALHDHRGAGVSGVLWIAAPPAPPDLEHSGALFVALRGPDGRRPGAYAVLRPSEGAAVLFDGDLPHAVLPVAPDALRGPDDARVSLSFNFPA